MEEVIASDEGVDWLEKMGETLHMTYKIFYWTYQSRAYKNTPSRLSQTHGKDNRLLCPFFILMVFPCRDDDECKSPPYLLCLLSS